MQKKKKMKGKRKKKKEEEWFEFVKSENLDLNLS